MSISAISSLVATSSGKATQSAPRETASTGGMPLDFAALLAGQPPPSDLTGTALLASVAKDVKVLASDGKRLDSPTNDAGAEGILATLTAGSGLAAASGLGETDGKGLDKKYKTSAASDSTLPDPGAAAQYILPPDTLPVQNRQPSSAERDTPDISKEGPSPLPEQRNSKASTLPASAGVLAQTSATPISSRADTANTAILAGESNPGSSGNTPAFASALVASGATSSNATTSPTAQPSAVNSALGSPTWSNDFAGRVVWLTRNDQQLAQININPPQLGPVQISISLSGDLATTSFASPHAEVRQAIQDSLPQLREMFSAAGINLGQADVGSQLPSQNREAAFQFANEARSARENAILSPDSRANSSPAGIPIQRGLSLVDLFA